SHLVDLLDGDYALASAVRAVGPPVEPRVGRSPGRSVDDFDKSGCLRRDENVVPAQPDRPYTRECLRWRGRRAGDAERETQLTCGVAVQVIQVDLRSRSGGVGNRETCSLGNHVEAGVDQSEGNVS